MRRTLSLLAAVSLIITCSGCFWGVEHDEGGYGERDRGGYGEHGGGWYGGSDRGEHGGDWSGDRDRGEHGERH